LFGRLIGSQDHLEDFDEQARRRVRAAQLDAIVRLIPLSMSINVLNATVVAYAFWGPASGLYVTIWWSLIAMSATLGIVAWHRRRRNPLDSASARAIRHSVLHAAILGAIWGAAPALFFPHAGLLNQLFLACVIAGMISGGAFCLSTIPPAGLVYTWLVVAGSWVGLISDGEMSFWTVGFMLTVYAVFTSRILVSHGTLFAEHIRDKLDIEEQKEVIGVLLKEFEAHAGDWLWQMDADGRMIQVSQRFAAVVGRDVAELEGTRLSEIIDQPGQQAGAPGALFDFLAKRVAFRDLVVPVGPDTNRRFWLMSAKPVHDGQGKFKGYRGVGGDITEKQLAREHITRLAQRDALTGLPNRSFFQAEADRVLAAAREQRQTVAMLCVDLDQFKSVNDTLGHPVGDQLLRRVAERLQNCVRDRALIARLGGDEFAILCACPHGGAGVRAFAEEVLDSFRTPFSLDDGDIAIGASIGISVASVDNWQEATLLKLADMALYSAKSAGAGTYRFFEPDMARKARRRREIEVGLREAIDAGGLTLAFQPLVDISSGRVAGLEALARWHSPALGGVTPAEFIPVAETTGLMIPVGEWVLREAVRAARRWPGDMTVSVNVSPVQFRDPKFLATVVSALADGGLPAHRLELEVTESVFLASSEETLAVLNNLRTLGVLVSLDDFGTGYSSLSYLRCFPFNKIKIDKTFVQDLESAEARSILQAIVALAGALGMSTVGEGVETEAQLATLRELGCTQAQGYLFSRPRAEADIDELLDMATSGPGRGRLTGT
jgi:diguanylate cyclase (GGDEF)-like protein/PAS domain S-box-containing protein